MQSHRAQSVQRPVHSGAATMVGMLALALVTSVHGPLCRAQPPAGGDASARTVSIYVYLMDTQGNKALLTTNLAREDPRYDDRALHRFLEVLTGLEKRGFHKDDNAYIQDWDKPEPFAR